MVVVLNGGAGVFDILGHYIDMAIDINTSYQVLLETSLEASIAKSAITQRQHVAALLGRQEPLQDVVKETFDAIFATARDHFIQMVDDDTKLAKRDLKNAAKELYDQMITSSDGLSHTLASSVEAATAGNTGTGEMVVGLQDFEGAPITTVRSERLVATCVLDAQESDGRNPGAERFSLIGEERRLASDAKWPGGSGGVTTIDSARAADDAKQDAHANVQTNSGFENFTSGKPDNWDAVTGSATTNFDETSNSFTGSKALQLIGDGATLVEIRQLMGITTGTARSLIPKSVYAMGFWYRMDTAAALAAGVLRVQFQDGSGTVLSVTPTHPAAAINARITVDLTSSPSVTYAFASQVFITPAQIPSDLELAIELTTAITSSREVFIDELVVQRLTPAYPGGPNVGLFRGDTDWVVDDEFVTTITNNDAKTNLIFGTNWILDLQSIDARLPTLAAPTISDALITTV